MYVCLYARTEQQPFLIPSGIQRTILVETNISFHIYVPLFLLLLHINCVYTYICICSIYFSSYVFIKVVCAFLFVVFFFCCNFWLSLQIAGDVESALSMTNELLQLLPTHERANGNKVYYEKELKELSAKKKVKGDDGSDETPKSDLVS